MGRGQPQPESSSHLPLHVLVVDDSAVVRQALQEILRRRGGMRVSLASDPIFAMRQMAVDRPDVIVLDLEMPRMDGLTFLRQLIASNPLPVVVCSALTGQGSAAALRALEEGAVDVIGKPSLGVKDFLADSAAMVVDAVRAAALARVAGRRSPTRAERQRPPRSRLLPAPAETVVAIGASTGGTEALHGILSSAPPDSPALLVALHMPEHFTAAFARRIDELCAIEVREARHGDQVNQGVALIAPGGRHMRLHRGPRGLVVHVVEGPLVSRHRPSVDVLFQSVAAHAGTASVGVLLTGMGDDGAEGLLAMRRAGAATIAQDEASCVVFGMPKAAIDRGAAEEVVPLANVAERMLILARRQSQR